MFKPGGSTGVITLSPTMTFNWVHYCSPVRAAADFDPAGYADEPPVRRDAEWAAWEGEVWGALVEGGERAAQPPAAADPPHFDGLASRPDLQRRCELRQQPFLGWWRDAQPRPISSIEAAQPVLARYVRGEGEPVNLDVHVVALRPVMDLAGTASGTSPSASGSCGTTTGWRAGWTAASSGSKPRSVDPGRESRWSTGVVRLEVPSWTGKSGVSRS
jgi:hypothetical protein